jgi:hypothetical protein
MIMQLNYWLPDCRFFEMSLLPGVVFRPHVVVLVVVLDFLLPLPLDVDQFGGDVAIAVDVLNSNAKPSK